MWQSTTVRVVKKSSHEPISPSSIPLCTLFFHTPSPSWSSLFFFFFYVQFLSVFLIWMPPYGMCIGRLEELIGLFLGLCAAPPHPEDMSTKRKAWDQVGGKKRYRAHCDDSYTPLTQSQHQQTAIRHPPSSMFYFGSFNQFVSSALTSSSTRSKVITLHYPPSCSLHATHSPSPN